MIEPTVGRVVHFYPNEACHIQQLDKTQPLAATIVFVFNNRLVNLAVHDSYGRSHGMTSVLLRQDDDKQPPAKSQSYCEWMPFQKGQAQKTEELEKKLKERPVDEDNANIFEIAAMARDVR